MSTRKRQLILGLILCLGINTVPAAKASEISNPSFDCDGARNAIETEICSDPYLGGLDRKMADLFAKVLRHTIPAARADVRRDQARWLNERNACGTHFRCLEDAYATRIRHLGQDLAHLDAPAGPAPAPARAPDFVMVPNAGIPGHNREVHNNVSVQQCKVICIARPWCKSVDYQRAAGKCFVQPVSEEDTNGLRRDYPGHPYDHYFYMPRQRPG